MGPYPPLVIRLYGGDAIELHRAIGGENPRHAFLRLMDPRHSAPGDHWRVDLTREEAERIALWLIRNAPHMSSQPGSGRTEYEIAREAAAQNEPEF